MHPKITTFGKRPSRWLIGAAALAAVFGVTANVQTALAQKIVTVVLSEEPEGLDGCNANRSTVGRVAKQNIVETLTEIDPKDGNITPRLATSWSKVNATTWRFELRQGVKFHDGAPLNAETGQSNDSRSSKGFGSSFKGTIRDDQSGVPQIC